MKKTYIFLFITFTTLALPITSKSGNTTNSRKTEAPIKDTVPTSTAASQLSYTSKYDFVPGDKVISVEDFSQDAVGDFPAKWNTNSSGEVVTLEGQEGHWLMLQKK